MKEMNTPPYFLYPLLQQLRQHPEGPEADALRLRIAANVGDPEALYALIGEQHPELATGGASSPTADSTIDSFIEKFSRPSRRMASRITPAPASDYFSTTERLSDDEERPEEETASANLDYDEAMEEVKKSVKNGDYQHALAIMEEIYLNNPKKSIYFADQMRFVKKLMELKSDKKQ